MTERNNSSSDIKAMYEALPYPPREPRDERTRLIRTSLDYLPKISHYCFDGALCQNGEFRVLVAGGGTGDAAIYLAEQLRKTGSYVEYLDVSAKSLSIARERSRVRGLTNIGFTQGSLLKARELYTGTFDYINCSGVLHHLAVPDAGLAALRSVLANRGAIGIMVYAKYGRTAVYHIQELLQRLAGSADFQTKIELARRLLGDLPETNWFSRSKGLHSDHIRLGDAGLADLFLNPCDRAFTVPELYAWLEQSGLHFIDYASHRLHYQAERYIHDPAVASAIRSKPPRDREAIAELLAGTIIKHTFYAAKEKKVKLDPSPDLMPVFAQGLNVTAINRAIASTTVGTTVPLQTHDAKLNLPVNPISQEFFAHLGDGKTLGEICQELQRSDQLKRLRAQWVRKQVTDLCQLLIDSDMLYLNKPSLFQTNAQ